MTDPTGAPEVAGRVPSVICVKPVNHKRLCVKRNGVS